MIFKAIFQLTTLACIVQIPSVFGQERFSVSGTIRDAATGETLIGASIKLEAAATAGMSNAYGFYSLSETAGEYTLTASYTGYQVFSQRITLNSSQQVDIKMNPGAELAEVVISATEKNKNVRSAQMGENKVDMKALNDIPVLLGEKDILKTIQMLPGVKSGGEGNTGFFVRGGAADQNLILLDEATVYNSSHLLGFFSTFNADAIKDVSLYKGGIPAHYGGRLSSVLDVKMQDGNNQEYGVEGGIGLIASRLKLEGPIVKDKSSFMISARRTYLDLLLNASGDSTLTGNTLNFYDVNIKGNYKLRDNTALYVSGYFGKDNMGIKNHIATDWGNATATLRLNHVFNSSLFSNTSFIFTKYNYSIEFLEKVLNFRLSSHIRDYNFKQDMQYYTNKHNIRFGLQATFHHLAPSKISAPEKSLLNPLLIDNRFGAELAGYLSDEWALTDKLNLLYGVRVSSFSMLGPGEVNTYNRSGEVTSTTKYKKGQLVKTYLSLEPRFSLSYSFNEANSIKSSYSRSTQNIHLLTNSSTGSPTDQYVMSSNNIKPELADQVTAGYFRNFKDNEFEFSAEAYYKWLQHQIDYKDGAELFANANVESELLYGNGRAYGLELYAKKLRGRLTGWLSYTLARTERKFEGINQGKYYPARQDRTHDLAVVGMYSLNSRWTLSANYIYSTGNAVTYPAGKYDMNGITTFYYTERNANRMPYTGRLDLSATLKGKETRRFSSSWNIGLYNALNRQNPYFIRFRDNETDPSRTEAVKTSLFGIIPSLTWNFKF